MIRIITENRDHTINRLIDNLVYLELPFERINTDQFTPYTISNLEKKDDVKIIYNRRGSYNLFPQGKYNPDIWRYLKKEVNDVIFFLESLESQENIKIGSLYSELSNNKILNLKKAKEVGFQVPDTLITNVKSDLINFFNKHEKIITKDLKYPVSWINSSKNYRGKGTFVVKESHIEQLNNFFTPMIFQEAIDRKFEIRTFFFIDMFFSVAIIPPSKTETIDIRNTQTENRILPYKLPDKIEKQLLKLSHYLGMNTFSTDIILDSNDNFIFLEVNPMGQYDFVDQFGNFDIPNKIALKLKELLN